MTMDFQLKYIIHNGFIPVINTRLLDNMVTGLYNISKAGNVEINNQRIEKLSVSNHMKCLQ